MKMRLTTRTTTRMNHMTNWNIHFSFDERGPPHTRRGSPQEPRPQRRRRTSPIPPSRSQGLSN
jgi:hypothetical protein